LFKVIRFLDIPLEILKSCIKTGGCTRNELISIIRRNKQKTWEEDYLTFLTELGFLRKMHSKTGISYIPTKRGRKLILEPKPKISLACSVPQYVYHLKLLYLSEKHDFPGGIDEALFKKITLNNLIENYDPTTEKQNHKWYLHWDHQFGFRSSIQYGAFIFKNSILDFLDEYEYKPLMFDISYLLNKSLNEQYNILNTTDILRIIIMITLLISRSMNFGIKIEKLKNILKKISMFRYTNLQEVERAINLFKALGIYIEIKDGVAYLLKDVILQFPIKLLSHLPFEPFKIQTTNVSWNKFKNEFYTNFILREDIMGPTRVVNESICSIDFYKSIEKEYIELEFPKSENLKELVDNLKQSPLFRDKYDNTDLYNLFLNFNEKDNIPEIISELLTEKNPINENKVRVFIASDLVQGKLPLFKIFKEEVDYPTNRYLYKLQKTPIGDFLQKNPLEFFKSLIAVFYYTIPYFRVSLNLIYLINEKKIVLEKSDENYFLKHKTNKRNFVDVIEHILENMGFESWKESYENNIELKNKISGILLKLFIDLGIIDKFYNFTSFFKNMLINDTLQIRFIDKEFRQNILNILIR